MLTKGIAGSTCYRASKHFQANQMLSSTSKCNMLQVPYILLQGLLFSAISYWYASGLFLLVPCIECPHLGLALTSKSDTPTSFSTG